MQAFARWKAFDPYLFATTLVLMGFGVVSIWSAAGGDAPTLGDLGPKQGLYGVLGVALMVALAGFNYRFLASFAWPIYLVGVGFLGLVLVLGTTIAGSQRWFVVGAVSIQPSEFGKLATLVALAAFVAARGDAMRELPNLLVSLLIVTVPAGLVFAEPDLGTAVVYGVIWLAVMLVTPARGAHLALLALLALPAGVAAWRFLLHDYQKERLLVSFDPSRDPLGAGFNILQARITIGAGGVFGYGFKGGIASQFGLLKVRESDFIFAHASAMFGFVGMLALFVSFVILLWRCLRVAEQVDDPFARCLAVGVAGLIFFQAVVNIGMNLGLMPVTGITLPFVSYGVSSLWTFLVAEGLLQSVLLHHRRLAFQPH